MERGNFEVTQSAAASAENKFYCFHLCIKHMAVNQKMKLKYPFLIIRRKKHSGYAAFISGGTMD